MGTEPVSARLAMPRVLLFDWDNTLVDSWPCIHEAMNTTLLTMGHAPWTLAETKARVGLSMREAFPLLFKDRWEEAREVFYARFRAIHLETLCETPGAIATVRALAGRGIRLAVVSNKAGPFLRREAEVLGVGTLFDALIGAGDAPRDKPAPDPGLMALAPSGVTPGPWVWFVGDTAVDLECAAALGCPGVLVRPEPPAPGEFATAPPDHHVSECAGLLDLVLRVEAEARAGDRTR